MRKKMNLLVLLLFSFHFLYSQCITPPAFPVCNGTEPLVVNSDNITVTQTKYFYGAPATVSNVKLSGGTLVVSGNLTLSDLVLDSGMIFIHPSATLIITNGGGLVLRGNSAIYNKGIFQCMGNIVLDNTYVTAAKPNALFNDVLAQWKMQNQYFVINNPFSWFVNNGLAEFHGIITDPLSAPGCICLGDHSHTNLTVLYNKAKNTYVVPTGAACLSVSQYSQFYDTLTAFPSLNVCLGNLHNSDATCTAWGCKPNAWGAAQVVVGCSTCRAVLTLLPLNFQTVSATAYSNYNEIKWEMGEERTGVLFYVERSEDGRNFKTVDSVRSRQQTRFSIKDFRNTTGMAYYRIVASDPDGRKQVSKTMAVRQQPVDAELFPNPFYDQLNLTLPAGTNARTIEITDALGHTVQTFLTEPGRNNITLHFSNLAPGLYYLMLKGGQASHVYKILKK
jgi:hypothetical protein